jgi:myo-inositol-1(or 4)-monophosphatase
MTAAPTHGLEPDLDLVLEAVAEAGRAVMADFRTDHEVRHKGPDQPVTPADLAADRILRERLSDARPAYGWLSEETADQPDRLRARRVWIVDPIDGTRSFIAGYREFAVSVGLVEDGLPVLGVVYNPAREDLFWAIRGAGASRIRHWKGGRDGGRPLRLAAPADGQRPALLASRTEIARGELHELDDDWIVRPLGSTAYKLAAVAAGMGHAFMSRGPKSEWDVVAGGLIVAESGGRVTDVTGRAVRYNGRDPYVHGVLAGVPALVDRLLGWADGRPAPRLRADPDGGAGVDGPADRMDRMDRNREC